MASVTDAATNRPCKLVYQIWSSGPCLVRMIVVLNIFYSTPKLYVSTLYFCIVVYIRRVEFCYSTPNASRKDRKWGTECLNTGFPLPTMLCARYSVKLIYFICLDKFFESNIVLIKNVLGLQSQCVMWAGFTKSISIGINLF